MTSEKHIPVGTVCAMYGLNPNTLRTWERRYQFPSPQRSEGGHRAYSAADIALIGTIMELIKSGHSPAQAIAEARSAAPRRKTASPATAPPRESALFRSTMQAIKAHDQARLRSLAKGALQKMGYQSCIEDYAFPLLVRLGHSWEETSRGVADEHSFTMIIESIILQHGQQVETGRTIPVVTFACAPGESHQLALLHLANLAAENQAARPLILAAGLPIQETLEASKTAGASAIVLSATIPPSSVDTRAWVKAIIDAGYADKLILAGPGFVRSRVYKDQPVKAAVGGFTQTVDIIKAILERQ